MNEEEKEAIEYWKTHIEILHFNTQIASEHYIKVLLDLVENQQEEIEHLRELLNKYNDMKYFAVVADRYISKDKIKEKIKELENIKEQITTNECMLELSASIDILKELLGE